MIREDETAEDSVMRILKQSRAAVDRLWNKVLYVADEEVHTLVCAMDELAMVAIRERKEAISWRDRCFQLVEGKKGGKDA